MKLPTNPAVHRLCRLLGSFASGMSTWATKLLDSPVLKSILLGVLWAVVWATFLVPWDGGKENMPSGWDTALGTAAQIIGGATAVVFALLVVPVQNAAAKYSPIFLGYIRRDFMLRWVFFWTLLSLAYALVALSVGATPIRVAVTISLTVMSIFALAAVALRVMMLLNPVDLGRMIESESLRRLPRLMADQRAQFERTLKDLETAAGQPIPASLRHYPVPNSVVHFLHGQIQPLLGVTAGAIETGQVDVVRGGLTSVTNIVHAYLRERGTSATANDPLISRVSEELYSLSQVAQRAISQQVLLDMIRSFGRIAISGVEVSSPGVGIGEHNVALLPIGYLRLIATSNVSNIHSVAPTLATEQLGTAIYQLLQRGLPSSTAGAIGREIAPIMQLALQPYAYHVAAVGARWLMRVWTLSSSAASGGLVRRAIQEVVEVFLRAYRQESSTLERQQTLGPLLDPLSDQSSITPALPAGAAVALSLLQASWPPEEDLIEDIRHLGDAFVRELLWPAASAGWPDWLTPAYGTRQTIEMAVLLAAIASSTIRHPKAVDSTADGDTGTDEGEDSARFATERHASEQWEWLTTILFGTCGKLTEEPSEDSVNGQRWELYEVALSGASACIMVALASLERRQSPALVDALGRVLTGLSKLTEEVNQKWGRISALNALVQHLRMLGAWLLATGHNQLAHRLAELVAKAAPPNDSPWEAGNYWSRRYPTTGAWGRWQPPIISITGQRAVPHYLERHAFMDDSARQRFEELIEQVGETERDERSGEDHS